ncbi:MAG: hypothetical protein MUP75_00970 [Nitrosopumilus sp.]|nr:hypothetical protein [Nitrosopumilus sp.]
MQFVFIILIIALVSIAIGTVGSEYYNEYVQQYELESMIVSCMEQYGHYSDKLVNCLNDNSLSNP